MDNPEYDDDDEIVYTSESSDLSDEPDEDEPGNDSEDNAPDYRDMDPYHAYPLR